VSASSTAMLAEHELGYGPFNGARFAALAAFYCVVSWFAFSGASFALALLCCLMQAQRVGRLAPGPNTDNALGQHVAIMAVTGVAIAIAHYIAAALGAVTGLIAAYVLLFHLRGDTLLRALLPTSTKTGEGLLPMSGPPVAVELLVRRREELVQAVTALKRLSFFDAASDAMKRAWERRDIAALEALLTQGDALNRQSWRSAGETYNACAALVDLVRTRLAQGMKEAEPIMRQRGIDPGTLKAEISARLAGDAKIIAIEKPRRLQPQYGRGLGQAWGKAATGNMPWQAALAMTAAATVLVFIQHSKRMRQLKETEGQIVAMAAEMRGDASRFRALIETRLLPQYDWALSVLDQLARYTGNGAAVKSPNQPMDESALRFGFAVAEGKMVVERKAGN
jgi:hypothetical protein